MVHPSVWAFFPLCLKKKKPSNTSSLYDECYGSSGAGGCIHKYRCAHTHTHILTQTYTRAHIHIQIHTYTYEHTHVYVCMYCGWLRYDCYYYYFSILSCHLSIVFLILFLYFCVVYYVIYSVLLNVRGWQDGRSAWCGFYCFLWRSIFTFSHHVSFSYSHLSSVQTLRWPPLLTGIIHLLTRLNKQSWYDRQGQWGIYPLIHSLASFFAYIYIYIYICTTHILYVIWFYSGGKETNDVDSHNIRDIDWVCFYSYLSVEWTVRMTSITHTDIQFYSRKWWSNKTINMAMNVDMYGFFFFSNYHFNYVSLWATVV